MARISSRELKSLGITVDATGQPTTECLARLNIPVPENYRSSSAPAPAPAELSGSEGTEIPEDDEITEDGELTEADEREGECEFFDPDEDDILARLFDEGSEGLSKNVATIWGMYNREKEFSNCHYYERRQCQEDMLCYLVREEYIEDLLPAQLEEDFLYRAIKNHLCELAMLVLDKVASTTHCNFGRFLTRYGVYIAAILDLGKESRDLGLPILQYHFKALARLENSDADLSRYRTQKSYKFLGGDSHPETIRAYMLYATLVHEGRNIGTLEWLLAQTNCPRRCKAVGDAHLFTALFEAAPLGGIGENHPYYYDAARRAAVCLWKKLDTLLESGYMDPHSPIDNSPTQTYLDNLTLLMNRDDQPETRNKILGPKRLRAFHWNNTKNHPTPLSYAMNHFVSVDLRSGKDHHEQYVASLQIALYLIRKGADPRRVDADVRRKVY
ncbi:hypothetical protein PG984_000367 [Apiospora sp. TS-2023a]